MNQIVTPGMRSGEIVIPASKSCAHRALICAALSDQTSKLIINGFSKDIIATMNCLNALGASISENADGSLSVVPRKGAREGAQKDTQKGAQNGAQESARECAQNEALLLCGESGSTLRFMIPVVGALGENGVFKMEGLLSKRPHAVLTDVLNEHGMHIWQEDTLLHVGGQLAPGEFSLPGNVSSQYISGMLFALPILSGDSVLHVTGKIESKDYIAITEAEIEKAGIRFTKTVVSDELTDYFVPGNQVYRVPEIDAVESDWSNAAFFFSIGAGSEEGVLIRGLNRESKQGDKRILDIVKKFGAEVTETEEGFFVKKGKLTGAVIDAAQIPDLVPTISVVAAVSEGVTEIIHAERLRMKESDRLATTSAMLLSLGAKVTVTEDGLRIEGVEKLHGGQVDASNDHRIAMAAAVAATFADGEVEICGAECVAKSYPKFFEDFTKLEVRK